MIIIKKSRAIILLVPMVLLKVVCAEEVEFNSNVLSKEEQKNIDLSRFSHSGDIVAGDYILTLNVNKQEVGYFSVNFKQDENTKHSALPCITSNMVNKFGLTQKAMSDIQWDTHSLCLNLASLPGLNVNVDLASATLNIAIPYGELEYSSAVWEPTARWDDGIPGILLDYNITAQALHKRREDNSESVNGNGTAGFNLGPWRFRADWQAYSHATDIDNSMNWSRIYAYRALRGIKSKLTLGESYLNSTLFDAFRFIGASLASDESMVAPHLRGYSPEISGVAKTNARVIITQQGRVIYDTQVSPGVFRIQDINSAVSGTLDIRVEEQDGSIQQFQVDTAKIPYLTRPGQVRYKLAMGKTSQWENNQQGEPFANSEFSWGVTNGWSLYGGIIASEHYQATSLGLGRDLLAFGAISADMSASWSQPEEKKLHGLSYRLSYAKRFDEYNSQISFAGYRFSDQDFMSMSDYLDAKYREDIQQKQNKEMYNLSLSKTFEDIDLSTYISYSRSTYWNQKSDSRYNITASKMMELGNFRHVSVNISAFTTEYEDNIDDNGMYLSLSIPFRDNGSITLSSDISQGGIQSIGYYDKINDRSSYHLSTGVKSHGGEITSSGSFIYQGSVFDLNINASQAAGDYNAVSMNLRGGVTLTTEGGALHRMNQIGSTRLLIDTNRISNIPINTLGADTHTNLFGKAVVNDINSFNRNSYTVNINKLADDVEVIQSVVHASLTEGAIGYRTFPVVSGEKIMATIKKRDHSTPPLGAEVTNSELHQVGIVGDDGMTYLSGLKPAQILSVSWNGKPQCQIKLPDTFKKDNQQVLLLLCK
ncbi:MAG: fimbria/pilus outer membrane usher protein [Plesiomonas sp.]|uniref:fimbria/pilus outer membrane usher protein n=1 Tax=Plesiomonas sp. TaxID=2486279 RepID=UPI003F34E944